MKLDEFKAHRVKRAQMPPAARMARRLFGPPGLDADGFPVYRLPRAMTPAEEQQAIRIWFEERRRRGRRRGR